MELILFLPMLPPKIIFKSGIVLSFLIMQGVLKKYIHDGRILAFFLRVKSIGFPLFP